MTANSPEKIPEDQLNHIKYFILFLISYFLAENIVHFINSLLPELFVPVSLIFQNLSVSVVLVVIILIIGRIITTLLPELNTTEALPLYVWIIPSLIISHPLVVSIAGSKVTFHLVLLDIIENRALGAWLLEVLLFAFAGYALGLIQSRSPLLDMRYHRIFQYLGEDLLFAIFTLETLLYLARSFIAENFESITLSIPVKLILVIAFYYMTKPIPDEESQEGSKFISN